MAKERLAEIRAVRLQKRATLLETGKVPYPAEIRRTHTTAEFTEQFEGLQDDTALATLVGRLTALRLHGAIAFADLTDASGTIQLQFDQNTLAPELMEQLALVDVGDFLQVTGQAMITKRGTRSLQAQEWHIVSKSIRPLPDSWYGLKDHETRYRQREVDLLLNKEVRTVFAKRAMIILWLRTYLESRGFLEVETPILQPQAGGASAKPFTTHHNALDVPLYLRIAPELYLKRLVVGGFEKVFEIGRNFRNEGIGREHNPEFTMLEFYWAYTDYEDLMDFTEELFEQLVRSVYDSTQVEWRGTTLNFAKPLARQRYIDLVSKHIGFDILENKDPQAYIEAFAKRSLAVPTVLSYTKMVDEFYKEVIRPTLLQPTLLFDYPIEMVPLGKHNLTDSRVAEKFQFVVGGMELVNAYTELNDPVEQRRRFEQQQEARNAGDEEAQAIDEAYLRALEYGLPPTGGYGLGIDRLVMILTNTLTLRDTMLFPLLKPEKSYD